MMPKKKPPMIYVEWDDSCVLRGWQSPEGDHTVAKISSVGFLIREEKHALTISTSLSDYGNIMDGLTIPKAHITKRRRVKGM